MKAQRVHSKFPPFFLIQSDFIYSLNALFIKASQNSHSPPPVTQIFWDFPAALGIMFMIQTLMKGHFQCVTDLCALEGAGKHPWSSSFSLGSFSSAGDTGLMGPLLIKIFYFLHLLLQGKFSSLTLCFPLQLDISMRWNWKLWFSLFLHCPLRWVAGDKSLRVMS